MRAESFLPAVGEALGRLGDSQFDRIEMTAVLFIIVDAGRGSVAKGKFLHDRLIGGVVINGVSVAAVGILHRNKLVGQPPQPCIFEQPQFAQFLK